ncbi:uncharacterized protein [Rutidosis leptorrhynchoides]|uniref:uncharacterized protein n=1 Tax=Rutidosis leptorrhynchoides TaxID=125765 RepID=UPI003A990166
MEVPLVGKKFTWICDNGRNFSKLDWFLVSSDFANRWGDLSLVALERKLSDHCPIMLCDRNLDYGPKPFYIFDMWLERDAAEEIVRKAWDIQVASNRPNICFRKKHKQVKHALKAWNKSMYGSLDDDLSKLMMEADQWEHIAEYRDLDENEQLRWIDCQDTWFKKDKEKRDMLRQKARIKWASEGGENIKFFHSQIKRRHSKNNIRDLYFDGKWEEDPAAVKNEVNDPSLLNDYRPINLINSYYKVIAKVLANRLRVVVPKVMGSEQSAFIKDRSILDAALVLNEVVEFLKHKK